MNDLLRVGILFNTARIPLRILEKLRKDYAINEIYDGEKIWNELGITYPQQKKLTSLLMTSFPEQEFERLENFGARFITAFDLDYPAKLKDLKNPPVGLYVKGSADLNFPSAAIVGTRKCSSYGENIAKSLSKALAQAGIIVISGGAKGIDTASHSGALSVGGKTFAVFGNGLDVTYPKENRDLFERISENGALISEYPFKTPGSVWRYPERNRIISGMSGRVIVVESPIDGGAMITARDAKNLGRELWSVPGRINDESSSGANKLLQEEASALVNIEDFINEVYGSFNQLNFKNYDSEKNNSSYESKISVLPELTNDEKIIYSFLKRKDNVTLDTIIMETGLDLISANSAVMTLEASGLILSNAGRYSSSS